MTAIQEGLHSQKATAAYFGVTDKTLIEWRKAGIIKAIKINGLVRYHPDEIKRVEKENTISVRRQRRKFI